MVPGLSAKSDVAFNTCVQLEIDGSTATATREMDGMEILKSIYLIIGIQKD